VSLPQFRPGLTAAFLRGAIANGLMDSCVADELAWHYAELRSRTQLPLQDSNDFSADIVHARLYEIASFIKPAAHGLLTLAEASVQADRTGICMLPIVRPSAIHYPLPRGLIHGKLAVFLNEPPADGATAEHADIFGPNSVLGLRAVTLAFSPGRPSITELGLVLPVRNMPLQANKYAWRSGFTVVRLGTSGSVIAQTSIPNQAHANTPPERFLCAALGLVDAQPVASHNPHAHERHIDRIIGLEDGFNYLTAVLPWLGSYLGSVAQQYKLQRTRHR